MKILREAWIRYTPQKWVIEPSMPWVTHQRYHLDGHTQDGDKDSVLSPSARLYIFEGRWEEDRETD